MSGLQRVSVGTWLVMVAAMPIGCSNQRDVVPVSGKVLYNGKPLEFGAVLFQPVAGGPIARGVIQPDGSFRLTTYTLNDGAILGKHQVRVTCFESQRAGAGGQSADALGPTLIPTRYNNPRSSGLEADVTADNTAFTFELTD